ncbi:hypothetical protein LJC33_06285 [Eubacteriales bacterium OttesenSCG-928-N13]|nr:hypothetical protein [Eubacteriales bacterium OttesenSCG-928-N13]
MKRIICLLLSLILCLAMPFAAMAAEGDDVDPAIYPMHPAMDSVLRTTGIGTEPPFDVQNDEVVWTVLYLMGVNWSNSFDAIVPEGADLLVPATLMEQFARAAFAEFTELPEIPIALSFSVAYDEETETYALAGSDAGDSYTEIDAIQMNDDGSAKVTLGLYMYSEEGSIGSLDFTLVPDPNVGDGSPFAYRIASIG